MHVESSRFIDIHCCFVVRAVLLCYSELGGGGCDRTFLSFCRYCTQSCLTKMAGMGVAHKLLKKKKKKTRKKIIHHFCIAATFHHTSSNETPLTFVAGSQYEDNIGEASNQTPLTVLMQKWSIRLSDKDFITLLRKKNVHQIKFH